MAQARQTSQSAPKASSGVVRKSNIFLTIANFVATGAVTFFSFCIPPIAAAINHTVDRITNKVVAKRELKARMNWCRPQIARIVGKSNPAGVSLSDFKKAAEIDPWIASIYNDVTNKEGKSNRDSAIFNAATWAIPGVAAVEGATKLAKFASGAATLGKQMAVTTTGGLLMDWASKTHINAMEVAEGISSQLNAAREQGRDPHEVVTPQMVFLLRVAQDAVLEAEIKRKFHKPFQKMSDVEQQQVMLEYKPLADAVTSEAHSIAQGDMPVQELLAGAPNLQASAAKYRMGAQNGSFVDNLKAQRARAQTQQFAGPVN